MKVWIMITMLSVLAIAGFAFVNALDTVDSTESVYRPAAYSGSCGASGCTGGCTAENNCGNSECGYQKTGGCGCSVR